MQLLRLLLLLLSLVATSSLGMITPSPTTGPTTGAPNRLEIVRTPGINHTHVTHEMVITPHVVQTLYTHMLTLPAAPDDQICPTYIIAKYQLTFSYNTKVIQKVNALNGECQPVTLAPNDIRTADPAFWKLVKQATDLGTLLTH